MEIDRSAVIKQAKKAFEIADYSLILTHRILATAGKKLIDHAYRRSERTKKYGKDFQFEQTDAVKDSTTYINNEMERMVSDLLDEVEKISIKTAKDQIAKIPKEKWDKEAFLAAVLFGLTYRQRCKQYTKVFRDEVEAYVKVGQERGKTAEDTVQWFMDNIQAPIKDDLIDEALAAGWIALSGMPAFKSFARLNDDMVTRGYHTANAFYWRYVGQKYIIAQRDSHTCSTCSDLDGKVFPIEEMVLPVHGSCRCIEIPMI